MTADRNFARDSATWVTSTGEAGEQANNQDVDPDVKIMVNMIFARLHHIYTHRFESAYGDDNTMAYAKREWAFALANYSFQAVESTLDAIRTRFAWPPTIAEFLRTLSEIGRPDTAPEPHDAYLEAALHAHQPRAHAWRHPLVYHAARNTGFYRLRNESEERLWPVFAEQYRRVILAWCRGEPMPEPEAAELPAPEQAGVPEFAVERWAQAQGLDVRAVAHLLHYADLPPGSAFRARLRARALRQLEGMGVPVDSLPD